MDIDSIVMRCGALVGSDDQGGFAHVSTAWTVGGGEWVTAWPNAEPPKADMRLMLARDGALAPIEAWEQADGIAGFRSVDIGAGLPPAHDTAHALRKRATLRAVGLPSLIDHPAFRLHRGSLDAPRYFPYLCSWTISGHLALFTADDGWIVGRCYPGMAGGPVLDERGEVVGLLIDTAPTDAPHPPLARFRRVD